jgi:YegS/Rv2252/BmrU family lipid kinase
MRHVFILNPFSGKGDTTQVVIAQAKEQLESRGELCEYRVTGGAGDATQFAREAAQVGDEVRIYACGGDGTVNEVVNGAAGYENAAVTVMPAGSGNDFIKIFGETEKYFHHLKYFADSKEALLDLIDCNGRLAVNICSVGLDARVGLGVEKFKKLPGISGTNAYLLSLLTNVVKGIRRNYRINVDGEELDGSYTLMAACSGRWYGGSFNPVPEAMPDDGLLDFVIVKGVSRLTVANLVRKYGSGRGKDFPHLITIRQGREMSVLCDRPAMINVDGERLDDTQVTFRLSEKRLRFFYPALASYGR